MRNKKLIPAVLAMALLLVLAAFFLLCLQGYSFSAICCTAAAGVIGFYTFVPRIFKKSKAVIRIFTIILCIGLLIFGITEAVILSASRGNPEEPAEYLLVLGAKVNRHGPSLTLRNRIDAAYDYLTAHPDTTAILSGGQGSDEPVTEARCMFDELTARGIDPERLWMEDNSTNTWENLKFSRAMLEENTGTVPEKIALLSSEFHLFRAQLFARRFGFDTVGVPAATSLPFLKVNYFLREAAAVWYYLIFGGKMYD